MPLEADWSVEVGADLPRIDVPWEGFVDLRVAPESISSVAEAATCAPLADALIALNSASSPVFTSKCDLWTVPSSEIDPDEFGARPETALCGFASYIDVLIAEAGEFASFPFHETLVKRIANDLRGIAAAHGRVDVVVRAARVKDAEGYGITLYAAGCGADAAARRSWEFVLAAAVLTTIEQASLSGE